MQILTIDLKDAARIIAQLVREGVTFEATQYEDMVKIVFTGSSLA